MITRSLAILVVSIFVQTSSKAESNFPSYLSDKAKIAYDEKYEPAARDKAFAITRDGKRFYYVTGLPTSERAARTASLRCLAAHGGECPNFCV